MGSAVLRKLYRSRLRTELSALNDREGRRSGVRPASWPLCRNLRTPLQVLRQDLRGYVCRRRRPWGQAASVQADPPPGRSGAVWGVWEPGGAWIGKSSTWRNRLRLALDSCRSQGSRHVGASWRRYNALSTHLASMMTKGQPTIPTSSKGSSVKGCGKHAYLNWDQPVQSVQPVQYGPKGKGKGAPPPVGPYYGNAPRPVVSPPAVRSTISTPN